ncbi:MAG: hypothetical protein ACLVIY_04340 [Anaerobutyricum soehngenii]
MSRLKRQAVTNADKTISSIKREMGTDYKVTIDDKKYTPQEISAMILTEVKIRCRELLRRKGNRSSYHCSCILQRCSETGNKRCR